MIYIDRMAQLSYVKDSVVYAPRKKSGEHIVVAMSSRQSVRPIRVRLITSLFEVGF